MAMCRDTLISGPSRRGIIVNHLNPETLNGVHKGRRLVSKIIRVRPLRRHRRDLNRRVHLAVLEASYQLAEHRGVVEDHRTDEAGLGLRAVRGAQNAPCSGCLVLRNCRVLRCICADLNLPPLHRHSLSGARRRPFLWARRKTS
jgi:hypothetical protein